MDIKVKEAVAWLTPFDTDIVLTPDHVKAVKTLIDYCSEPKQEKEDENVAMGYTAKFEPTKEVSEPKVSITCDFCHKELTELGGLIFSPPDKDSKVLKRHICKSCYERLSEPKVELDEKAVEEFIISLCNWNNMPVKKLAQSICNHFKLSVPSVEELAKVKLPYPATFTYASAIGVEPKVYEITLSYEAAVAIHSLLLERAKKGDL